MEIEFEWFDGGIEIFILLLEIDFRRAEVVKNESELVDIATEVLRFNAFAEIGNFDFSLVCYKDTGGSQKIVADSFIVEEEEAVGYLDEVVPDFDFFHESILLLINPLLKSFLSLLSL